MKSLYYFGGTFDPLTIAHEKIIKMLKEQELVIGISDIDKEPTLPLSARMHIINEFLTKNNIDAKVVIQDDRTYNFIHKKFPDFASKTVLVLGDDEWQSLLAKKWEHSEEILSEFQFKIVERVKDSASSSKARRLLRKQTKFKDGLNRVISKLTYSIIDDRYMDYFRKCIDKTEEV